MTPVRLEPAAPLSRVKHSTTEPLRSLKFYRLGCTYVMGHMGNMDKVTVMLYAPSLLKMQGIKYKKIQVNIYR